MTTDDSAFGADAVTSSESHRHQRTRTRATQAEKNPFTDPATTERTVVLLRRMYRRYLAEQSDDDTADAA